MFRKCVLKTLQKHWLLCCVLLLSVLGIMVVSLAPAYILQSLIDNVFSAGNENLSQTLLLYALIYFATLAFVGIFELIKQVLLVIIGESIMQNTRILLAKKLNTIDALYFSKVDSGQTTSIFVNDVDTINTIFTDGLVSLAIDLLKIVGIVVSMFVFSYVLGLITVALIPLIYLISHAFKTKLFDSQLKNRKLIGKANNHIGQSLKSMQIIKVFSIENYMTEKYMALLNDNFKAVDKVNFYDSIYSPIIKTVTALIIASLIFLSGVNVNILGITIGMLAGSINLLESLFSPIENLGMELQSLQSAMSGIKRVNDFLYEKDEEPKCNLAIDQIAPDKKINIRFEHLSFSYDNETKVLDDLNIEVANGEKVSIVGRTGVGKTTLFKLVTGLIKGQGQITLNGVDVYKIRNEYKPYLFGYVEQSFSHINGSIKDNITLGNENLSDSDVYFALDFALLGECINALPNGINTPFSATLFSQGQLQLFSIARAIVCNPPILLLDEITANLDTATEKQILLVLEKASDNRTILSISHRESSIINSDKIILIENGKISNIINKK